MSRLKPRERLLLVILIAAAAIQGTRFLLPRLRGGDLPVVGAGSSPVRREAQALQVADAATLDLDALEARSGELEVGRDPFRFAAPTPAPPPPYRPPPPPPPYEPPPPQGPQPPPVDVTFLGSFGPPERRIAVFSDGRTIYNATRGETLGGKFVVYDIGYESVDLTFVGFPDVPPERLAVGG